MENLSRDSSIIEQSIAQVFDLFEIKDESETFFELNFKDFLSPDLLKKIFKSINDKKKLSIFLYARINQQSYFYKLLLDKLIEGQRTLLVCNVSEFVVELLKKTYSPSKQSIPKQVESSFAKILNVIPKINEDLTKKNIHNILIWAKLEQFASKEYQMTFSPLTQSTKPIVYIFDDYNNYIEYDSTNQKFNVKQNIPEKIKKQYKKQRSVSPEDNETLETYLTGFCAALNNLSLSFEVVAPPLWLGVDAPNYEQVSAVLPLAEIAKNRHRIVSFIVDLEWMPSLDFIDSEPLNENWTTCGHKATYLLQQLFPEIACFIFTGFVSDLSVLQNALSSGASWIFIKGLSHHQNVSNDSIIQEPLNLLAFQEQLRAALNTKHRCYDTPPFQKQFLLDPKVPTDKKLLKRLGIKGSFSADPQGQLIQRIIAELLPHTDEVKPTKVLETGKSGAQATFFIRAQSSSLTLATRFIKIASWFDVQRDYRGYNEVIFPQLNSYVANIVHSPVFAQDGSDLLPIGALMYSTAGFPEGTGALLPFDQLLELYLEKPEGRNFLCTKLHNTFEQVLKPLYQNNETVTTHKRPVCSWFANYFPPLTGVLVPLDQITANNLDINKACVKLRSNQKQGYKDKTAWILASTELKNLHNDLNPSSAQSPWQKINEKHKVLLSDWILEEVEAPPGEHSEGFLTLSHPDLQLQLKLRGQSQDICRRFGANWIRPGMPVNLVATIDTEKQTITKLKTALNQALIKTNYLPKTKDHPGKYLLKIFKKYSKDDKSNLTNPFDVFHHQSCIPYHYTIEAHQGAIHGDLNLNNILFASEQAPVGWLIDFDRAENNAAIAADFAKLEIEIWNHHLSPWLQQLSALSPQRDHLLMKLVEIALDAADYPGDSVSFFQTKAQQIPELITEAKEIFIPIHNCLALIDQIRHFAYQLFDIQDHQISPELSWALGSYAFSSIKFKLANPIGNVIAFLISAWHLDKVVPKPKFPCTYDSKECFQKVLAPLKINAISQNHYQAIDHLLLNLANQSEHLPEFTQAMAESELAQQVNNGWKQYVSVEQKWDFASTGCVANISPIVGYLWLMVAADQASKHKDESTEEKIFTKVVPKISSRGNSCGTVDILEAGGYQFTDNIEIIQETCSKEGGIICHQDDRLTPIDKALMKRRKSINLMKNVSLVYASILSKKIALGITHTVVDVKLGKDTKIFWENNKYKFHELSPLQDKQVQQLVLNKDYLKHYGNLLEKELGLKNQLNSSHDYLCQTIKEAELSSLKEVRWILTNADMPQCRAIGRQLILYHLDQIFSDEGDGCFDNKQSEYYKLYRKTIPEVCGIKMTKIKTPWKKCKDQWTKLKQQLPKINDFIHSDYLKTDQDSDQFEEAIEVDSVEDLNVITFCLSPYQLPKLDNQKHCIQYINAAYLDTLFDWLTGENPMDEEVGIWLHKLPGELTTINVNEPEKNEPFITIFYRPSRNSESELKAKIRQFLTNEVKIVLLPSAAQ